MSLHADPTSSTLLLSCPISPRISKVWIVLPFAIRAEQMEMSPSFHAELWISFQWPRWSCTSHPHLLLWKDTGLPFLLQVRPAWYCPGEIHLWWNLNPKADQPCTPPLDSAWHCPSSVAPWLCHRARDAAMQRHSLAEAAGLGVGPAHPEGSAGDGVSAENGTPALAAAASMWPELPGSAAWLLRDSLSPILLRKLVVV